jgi:hypothetical protein
MLENDWYSSTLTAGFKWSQVVYSFRVNCTTSNSNISPMYQPHVMVIVTWDSCYHLVCGNHLHLVWRSEMHLMFQTPVWNVNNHYREKCLLKLYPTVTGNLNPQSIGLPAGLWQFNRMVLTSVCLCILDSKPLQTCVRLWRGRPRTNASMWHLGTGLQHGWVPIAAVYWHCHWKGVVSLIHTNLQQTQLLYKNL